MPPQQTEREFNEKSNVQKMQMALPALQNNPFTFSKMQIKATEILKNVK